MNAAAIAANDIELRWSPALTGERLVVAYEIENRSQEDVYVFDAMFELKQGPRLNPSLAYTLIEGELLTLFRGVPRIPAGMQVEAPELPFARLLAAGATLSSTIDTTVPLPFNHPYQPHDHRDVRSIEGLRLRIGYARADDLIPPPEIRVIDGAKLYRVGYRAAVDVQRFLQTQPAAMAMRVVITP